MAKETNIEKEILAHEAALAELKEKANKARLDAETKINKIASDGNFFVGITIDKNDILKILDLMLRSGESIQIPFQIYNKNKSDGTI